MPVKRNLFTLPLRGLRGTPNAVASVTLVFRATIKNCMYSKMKLKIEEWDVNLRRA